MVFLTDYRNTFGVPNILENKLGDQKHSIANFVELKFKLAYLTEQ